MVKPYLFLLVFLSFSFSSSGATTPGWSEDVAPIVYNNCATCHRTGSIAPFNLLSYYDAVAHAGTIKVEVNNKTMPPWPPDPGYSRMAHERLLTAAQIKTITDWIDGGMPKGDTTKAPPVPVFSPYGDLPGTPDYIAKIPVFTSTAGSGDVYQCFVIPSGIAVDKFITAFEAIPGNRACVHHVLVYADTTGTCSALDAASPGPGYVNFGGVGTDKAMLLGGWVPGSAPLQFPKNFGVRLPANADIVLQIHYPEGTAGMKDSTEVHFFFASSPAGMRDVFISPVLNHETNIDKPLFIPANTTKTFLESFTVPFVNFSVLGVAPHMHLIGKSIKSYGVTAALDTQKFISIEDWEFHWQGFYLFPKIKKVTAGTTLYAEAFYDNTSANHHNPNVPPKNVGAGEASTDEMMIVYFIYSMYQPGDENVIIDSAVATGTPPLTYYRGQQLLDPFPNPASNNIIVKCHFDRPGVARLDVTDVQGRVVARLADELPISSGYSTFTYAVDHLADGIYWLRMHTRDGEQVKQLCIRH